MKEEKDFDEDFNITDHIVKKESTNWEEKWDKNPTKEDDPFIQQPNTYTLYLRPELPPIAHIEVSKEPWYRRFENKRKNKRK